MWSERASSDPYANLKSKLGVQRANNSVRNSQSALDQHTSIRRKTLHESWEQAKKSGERPDSFIGRLVFHPHFETFGGCIVALNFIVMTMETHATAIDDGSVLRFVEYANRCFFIYYIAELSARLYVFKLRFFASAWNFLDLIIVFEGVATEMLKAFHFAAGPEKISMLKSLRMLRLIRVMRLLVAFRELYVLVAGIGRCMKTLFWASGLIFAVLNVWAIVGVEFLDEKVKDLMQSGVYSTCGWCGTAFSNIWYSNLTWFQIISTADWAVIGRPLAEEFFWPYAIFILNVFVVIWGLLNIIVAAIVDASIAAREEDYVAASKNAENTYAEAWLSFERICREMDADDSGDISVDEFLDYLTQNVELRQHMAIMGVRAEDVRDLLKFMDSDGDGSLECELFIQQFSAMRTLVEKTSLFFLMKYSQSIQERLVQQSVQIDKMRSEFAALVHHTCGSVDDEHMAASVTPGYFEASIAASATSQIFSAADKQKATEQGLKMASRQHAEMGDAGTLKTAAQELRKAAQFEMPALDMERPPSGWYYFGNSPPFAVRSCETLDLVREDADACTSNAPQVNNNVTKGMTATTGGQGWEPLPSLIFRVKHAKYVYINAPKCDVELPQEVIDSVAALDKYIGSLCSVQSLGESTQKDAFSSHPEDDAIHDLVKAIADCDDFVHTISSPSEDDPIQ